MFTLIGFQRMKERDVLQINFIFQIDASRCMIMLLTEVESTGVEAGLGRL